MTLVDVERFVGGGQVHLEDEGDNAVDLDVLDHAGEEDLLETPARQTFVAKQIKDADNAVGVVGRTGCSLNILLFWKILKHWVSLFSLGVSVCTHNNRQVEHQRCSRTGRVQKNHQILRKTQYFMNTLYL